MCIDSGTKQESQAFDEEAFASYISETELMSDSVSIFSDMNMSDSSGGALFEISSVVGPPMGPMGPANYLQQQKKKMASSTPKKLVDGAATSTDKSVRTNRASQLQTPVLLQHVKLPEELGGSGIIVKHLLPTLDGKRVIVIIEDEGSSASESGVVGALLSYDVVIESGSIRLSPTTDKERRILSREELVVSACFIPPNDADVVESSLLAMALSNGTVTLVKLDDFSVSHSITYKEGDTTKINAVSYVSSMNN